MDTRTPGPGNQHGNYNPHEPLKIYRVGQPERGHGYFYALGHIDPEAFVQAIDTRYGVHVNVREVDHGWFFGGTGSAEDSARRDTDFTGRRRCPGSYVSASSVSNQNSFLDGENAVAGTIWAVWRD